jgi:hypothetical protein
MLLVALWLLLGVAVLLVSWTGGYNSQGELTIETCDTRQEGWFRQLRCDGELVAEPGAEPVPSIAVGSVTAFEEAEPKPGSVVEVFYQAGEPSLTYPQRGRSVELARAILGMMPVTILIVGLATWLLGWALTRTLSPFDAVLSHDVAQRFLLRSYGLKWIVVGALWLAADRLLLTRLLGPVGLG